MLDVYKQALENTGRVIAGVKASQLTDATPCRKFTVGDLMNHIIGGCYFVAEVSAGRVPDPSAPTPDLAGDDPVTAYEAAKKVAIDAYSAPDSLTKTWKFPFGDMPGPQALGLGVIEAAVHAWDLAKATGQKHGIDPNLATTLLEGVKQGIGPSFRNEKGDPFGPEVKVPDNADPVSKLVAFLGRTP